ncbi:Glutathione gamma-glutamylcysteinyltransferase [Crinalium epipsammum PCC 9333]|uniref:glutathione gamma-glutamylcysteinyltransferase n=1 Tax=Crinalium epipsammum PCC 9333 TaxID=1173022 RepID=K9VU88_9CYAN|nr:phytochelatin synthase family protein [Crinalium epipsammum]AFZ11668.1 Glutathione gamma-glutamylcysteinyltransferase [Crinalium epipsammum PCC 9333]
MDAEGFYRRALPPQCIAFSSAQGRKIFAEALTLGGMEGYFALAEQFHTQVEPAFCGLGTLVVVLNALSIDPGRIWKGVWRWYGEEFLDCCKPLPVVKEEGITFDELACLARCNGAKVASYRSHQSSLEQFRQTIKEATSSPQDLHIIVSYSRQILGQTGDGHFSPVGGYHAERDLVLILDVARFKYPPHWVPLPLLWDALQPIDLVTGKGRGYMLLSKADTGNHTFYHVALDQYQWATVAPYFTKTLPQILAKNQPDSVIELVQTILQNLPPEFLTIVTNKINNKLLKLSSDVQGLWQQLLTEIHAHPLFAVIKTAKAASSNQENDPRFQWVSHQENLPDLLTMLLLSCPECLYFNLQEHLLNQVRELREVEQMSTLMRQEVIRLREQISALHELSLKLQIL